MDETNKECVNFVTVVSIGNENDEEKTETNNENDCDFVTVLRIGEKPEYTEDVIEEVLVYRLPGERLGFGLKFEGGTKAAEYVKRLFIQSCAPNSPASRVLSSWGNITEGDEVLEIDSRAVNSMTRTDCVKCLKDSNVIIKLLVRHLKEKENNTETKIVEDLPQVIKAEKKKLPPPPPPVPPRKIPRKLLKTKPTENKETCLEENSPFPPLRQKHVDANNNGNKPKCIKLGSNSPEIKRNRRYWEEGLGPADPEYYTDLFSQESFQSLSESDDTASTISTVIDRNIGSLPSTPRSIQKHLDISNFPDEKELFNINSNMNNLSNDKLELNLINGEAQEETKLSEESEIDLDETDFCCETKLQNGIIAEYKTEEFVDHSLMETNKNYNIQTHDENMNIFSLPRLVDFVPKASNDIDQTKIMNLFLENERSDCDFKVEVTEETVRNRSFVEEIDTFPKWCVSPQLATIGEDEEENNNFENSNDGSTSSTTISTPIVNIENSDENKRSEKIMESLPSDSRQPPDGHEFPDYEENFKKPKKISSDKFSLNYVHNNEVNINEKESYQKYSNLNMHKSADSNTILKNDHSINDETIKYDNSFNSSYFIKSQSLSDISYDKKQNEQWFNLVEQRRKSLSKLKGLVIPDSISENDCSSNINLPEIKSNTFANIETMNSLDDSSEASNETSQPSSVDSIKFPWISPPWTGNGNFPKYSPAFKRKDLSLYYTTANKDTNEKSDSKYHSLLRLKKSINQAESSSGDDSTFPLNLDNSSTRSESSFECTSSRNKPKQRNRSYRYSKESNLLNDYRKNKKEINTEDESDNDSTISSSQSSFISRTTPSPSPTGSVDYDTSFTPINSDYRFSDGRQLKSASVEAINRRNILASAKCRSGKDLKVGSPIINRKSPELDNEDKEKGEEDNKPIFETENEQPIIRDLPKDEEFKPIVKERTMIPKEPTLIIKEPPTLITKEPIPKVREIKVNEKENLQKNVEKENSLPKAKTFQPIPRRFSADKILDLQTKSSTAVLKNKFETMSVTRETPQRRMSTISTSRDYLSNYKDNLETNIQKKKEEKLSKFKNTKSLSVTDLRKNFEEIVKLAPNKSTNKISNVVVTSRKSDVSTPSFRGNKIIDKIPTVHESKVRSTLETKKLLNSKMANIDSREVILKPSVPSENIGIVLNGGRDENKEVTVHRIRYGSVAYQEGTLTKGDHIISINGVNTDGLSHFEATELLKTDARIFVILVRNNGNKPVEEMSDVKKKRSASLGSTNIPKISQNVVVPSKLTQSNHEIILRKDGNGLGFSIEGGKDSPIGDVPLVVKKIFQGGVADKDGKLKVGDEILVINDIECSNLSRIQAWTMMKKLDLGDVKILISR